MLEEPLVSIIIPPFAGIDRPSLGGHVLQALAMERGHRVQIIYANIIFASLIGAERYQAVVGAPPLELAGERLLSPFAYPEKFSAEIDADHAIDSASSLIGVPFERTELKLALNSLAAALATQLNDNSRIVGFSSTFEQINATIILSRWVHEHDPNILQILGGANCEGEMATGQAALVPYVSHIFSGESDDTFPNFLDSPASYSSKKVIVGQPKGDIENIPCPDFSNYFSQQQVWLSDDQTNAALRITLPYESSRGCWWGEKHHCTFCGLNGDGMGFRRKSAQKVFNELSILQARHGVNKFFMTDNIMPHEYFKTLLPALAASQSDREIFYEQKANMGLERVMMLFDAGVKSIQPGIESLSSHVLKLIKKGVSGPQNINLLRYCRSVGVEVAWNVIYGFPNESEEWYREMDRILPLISHLYPPSGLCDLSLDRFSPYFDQAEEYGIQNLRPHKAYSAAIYGQADLGEVAYHFEGDISGGLKKEA